MIKPLYIVIGLHNKIVFYLNKEKAEERLEQLKSWDTTHDYYIIESEVIE